MTTVWFLMALMAFSGVPAIQYKGYFAYHTEEECEMQRPVLENFIADSAMRRGVSAFYIKTFCLEMQAFENQLRGYKKGKQQGASLGI